MYQGKLDKNHKDKNTSLTVRNILYVQGVAEMLLCIMKKGHFWPTNPPLSIKRITTSHLKSLYTKRLQNMAFEIQFLSWDRHKKCE
jgi:hypothetical protein